MIFSELDQKLVSQKLLIFLLLLASLSGLAVLLIRTLEVIFFQFCINLTFWKLKQAGFADSRYPLAVAEAISHDWYKYQTHKITIKNLLHKYSFAKIQNILSLKHIKNFRK